MEENKEIIDEEVISGEEVIPREEVSTVEGEDIADVKED